MKKKILSVFLVLCMIFTLLPVSALADTTTSGKCGDNLTWTLKNGTLTISGTGKMTNYSWSSDVPWSDNSESITKVVIKDGVTSIGDYAFRYCESLTSMTIPNSVTSIGFCAFADCSSIESLTIPDSVTSIGVSAFNGCCSLTNMTIPGSVTSIGNYAFYKCSSLTSVTIPDSVTGVGEYAFFGCSSLTSITIPDGVTSIGDYAFSRCSSLTSVTIPNSVTHIGASAFFYCSSLTSVTIPNSVTSIGYYAFKDCTGLKSVTIGSSVTSIGDYAFHGCSSMKSINVSGSNTNFSSVDGVLFSKDMTLLKRCPQAKAGTTYSIPSSVNTIDDGAFYGCDNIVNINIPLSVKTIGDSAFYGCSKLKNVYYAGTRAQWKDVSAEYSGLSNETIHCSDDAVTAPATPVIKITTSAGKPKISWNAVDGATKYYIYRSTDGKTYKKYTSTTKTSYTNTKATIGTTYYYKVKAAKVVNGKELLSAYSNIKSVKCVPATPTLTISRVNGKPKLSWKAIDGASKYYIYRSTDGKTYKYYASTTKTSYTNTNVKVGTKYYYKVKAVAVVNKVNVGSAYSTAKSLLVSTAAPTVKITTSNGDPKISWSKVTGATKYYIYRSTDGKTYKYYTYTTKTAYTDTKAKAGTKYYYKVKAIAVVNKTNVASVYSNAVSVKAK